MSKPEPYRPSNGTCGMIFDENWCSQCQRDKAYREDPDHETGCAILTATLIHDIDDEDYPKEWVYSSDDVPICTAYQPLTDEVWPWATIPHPDQRELPL